MYDDFNFPHIKQIDFRHILDIWYTLIDFAPVDDDLCFPHVKQMDSPYAHNQWTDDLRINSDNFNIARPDS